MTNKEFLSIFIDITREWLSIQEKLQPEMKSIKSATDEDKIEDSIDKMREIVREHPLFFDMISSIGERLADPDKKREKSLDLITLKNEFVQLSENLISGSTKKEEEKKDKK